MESLLGEEEVSSCQISVTARKRFNFWSDRWITPECLQVFLEAIFLVVTIESLLCEVNVWSRQTCGIAEKGSNFWSDRWIMLKVLQYFIEAVFPCGSNGSATRLRTGLVVPDQHNDSKAP
jgi:hypothetical protein